MKKVFLFLLIVLIVIISKGIYAADISVGVTTWYAKMDFIEDENMKMEPSLLYGPLFNISFWENWGVSFVFLYGRIDSKEDSGEDDGGPDDLKRIDSDMLLNYNINRYFKVFAGCKYMSYEWDDTGNDGEHYSVGPGLGIGVVLPLGNSFYLLGNLSGIFLWGKHKENRIEEDGPEHFETDMTERGVNAKLSFAYYISAASTSVNLGFRYQYSKFVFAESDENSEDNSYMFYGVTLSTVYSFSI